MQSKVKNDTVIYKNEGKLITFLPLSETTQVSMEVFASKEYISPREENEAWPHLLLEQQISNGVTLDEIEDLNFKIDAKLIYSHMKMEQESFDESLHTIQITFYLLVQNKNRDSSVYGDFFWFGLPLYDFAIDK